MDYQVSTFPYRPTEDRSTGFFAPWWIRSPQHVCPGWEIDYTTSECTPTLKSKTHNAECFAGVLVKNAVNIWRLTGRIDNQGYFEGRWPD